MNTTDYLITCMLNFTFTLSPNLTVIACLNSISIYFFFLLFLRSDFNCACLSSEHSFWQCRGHLYPPVTFNAFETSMYLPAVLNNNGDKLKKKKGREGEGERERERGREEGEGGREGERERERQTPQLVSVKGKREHKCEYIHTYIHTYIHAYICTA